LYENDHSQVRKEVYFHTKLTENAEAHDLWEVKRNAKAKSDTAS